MGTLIFLVTYSFFQIQILTTPTSTEYISYGVARSICAAHKTFAKTETLISPFKSRPRGLLEKCVWFEKNQNCNSDSSCSRFTRKTCQDLGLAQLENQYPQIAPLIVGGRDVDPPFKYPSFAVFMLEDDPAVPDPAEFFPCGAVILSESWAITAQHCAKFYDIGDPTFVLGGRYNLSQPQETEQKGPVVQVINYPNTTQGDQMTYVDLSLLRIDPPFEFNKNISGAKFANKRYTEGEFTLVGYGKTNLNPEKKTFVPKEVEIPTISLERCRELADAGGNTNWPIQEHHICFSKQGGGAGGCYGDSGGPAYKIENGEQIFVGTTEGGLSDVCEQDGAISMYVEIFNFLSWIEEKTGISTSK